MRLQTFITVCVAVAGAAALTAAPTNAQPFAIGFGDDAAMGAAEDWNWWSSAAFDSRSGIYRSMVAWSHVAPTKPANPNNPADPAYDWSEPDRAVRFAAQTGLDPEFSVFEAPAWAEGKGRPKTGYGAARNEPPYKGSWKPSAMALKQFATALAKRYNGSTPDPLHPSTNLLRVSSYEAWNEPNYKMFLSPQFEGSKLVVINNYRALLNGFYAGIKSVQPTAVVSSAGLGPYGSSSQGSEVQPQIFTRGLLCLEGTSSSLKKARSCPTKATLDAISIHPYTVFGTPTTKAAAADGGAFGNTPSFKKAIDFAVSRRTVLPSKPKQLWVTEFGWLTNPPGRTVSSKLSLGVKPKLAAVYISEGIYRLWSWGVTRAIHFNLRDQGGFPDGLYFWPEGSTRSSQATPKPSLKAFRFPLMAIGQRGTLGKLWAISPCRGDGAVVAIQFRRRGRWTSAATMTPDASGLVNQSISIPNSANSVRGIAKSPGCSEGSITMPIYSK